jgi:PAS domain S-box-containing protein
MSGSDGREDGDAREEGDLLRVMGAAVMALAKDMVYIVEVPSLRVIHANRAFTQVLGYSPEEIPNLSVWDFTATDPKLIVEVMKTLEATSEMPIGLRKFRRRDGTILEIETSIGRTRIGDRVVDCVVARDPTERREAERVKREGDQRTRIFADAAFEGIVITDEGRIIDANERTAELVKTPLYALVGKDFLEFIAPASRADVAEHLARGASHLTEHELLLSDGTRTPAEIRTKTIQIGDRNLRVTAIRDISERKNLEEQVRLAQRMESVGRLAGGIAHDFNNLLTVILSQVDFLNEASQGRAELDELEPIRTAAERAAELTQQLLAFARKQMVEPKVFDLNELAARIDKLLRRVIGDDVVLRVVEGRNLGLIRADPGQIEQVLVNLVVNARDAMANGGRLTIETANVELGAEYAAAHPGVVPGSYVMLGVSDTGVGMSAATLSHIFEPFFTTKGPGKGTGLGLATCYGIVKQNGGSIFVYSEVGKGTTFKIYLPRAWASAERMVVPAAKIAARGNESLLLVEDDEMVRRVAVRILRGKGYTVHETGDPREALELFHAITPPVALLVVDVVMAGMSGKELAERLRGQRPELKVLYTSGYTENTIVHHGIVDAGVNFIAKPYVPEEFAQRVREVLDRGERA